MKILQIDKFYYPKYGTEKHVFALTRELKKHGHTVIPFSMHDEKNEPTPWSKYFVNNADVSKMSFSWRGIKTAFRMIYSFEARKKIRELIEQEKPDIAHIHLIHHHISPSILYELKKQGIPIVQTVHDYKLVHPNYFMWCNHKPCEKVRRHTWNKLIFHRCLKHSLIGSIFLGIETTIHALLGAYKKNIDLWIAPSEFVKRMLVEGGYLEEKIIVMPHAFQHEYDTNTTPSPLQGATPPPRGGDRDDGYLLFFGRLAPERGVNRLLDAMSAFPDTRLVIAGDGELRKELEQQAYALQLKSVEFVGYKQGKELHQLIKNCRAVVVPTLSHEVFGMSALEAMAYGKPCIVSDCGALTELVTGGENGWVVDPENRAECVAAIAECLADDERVAQYGASAQQKSKELTLSDYYGKIIGLYQTLIWQNISKKR